MWKELFTMESDSVGQIAVSPLEELEDLLDIMNPFKGKKNNKEKDSKKRDK